MTEQHISRSIQDLPQLAKELLRFFGDKKILLFNGEMGTGKTTFIKSFCEYIDVKEAVSSPTFSLVNEYTYPGGSIFHFDLYRLKSETEALDIGIEEYFDSGHYCLIEWSDKIPHLIPEDHVIIDIQLQEDYTRLFTFTIPGAI